MTKPKIEQVFHHYEKWEDWRHGMYRDVPDQESGSFITSAAALLSDEDTLRKAMSSVVVVWPIAAEVNLTNTSCNRRAWLGQAACCYARAVPEEQTRMAWWTLTKETRDVANGVADGVIQTWERQYLEAKGGECQSGQLELTF